MKTYNRAFFFLEEYTDFILYDKTRHSIVVNIKKDFFQIVYYELKKSKYKLVHKSTLGNIESMTLVFVKDE